MPTLPDQVKSLKKDLAEKNKTIERQINQINNLQKQIREGIENSPQVKAQILSYETELDLLRHKVAQLEKELALYKEKQDHHSMPVEIPRRGRKQTISDEKRQYIRGLAQIKNPDGKQKYSMQAIALFTGISKARVHVIIHEPDIPGRWYSIESGRICYYPDFTAAVDSQKEIHFEPDNP